MMATSKHKMCCAEYRATIRSRWGFRASKWLQHHDGRAAGCTSIDHGKFCSSLSVRRGASLFFPCPQRRSTELWAREFQRSSPGSFGKTTKLSWTLKYEKPLPTCLKFQLRPKTLVFGPPLNLLLLASLFHSSTALFLSSLLFLLSDPTGGRRQPYSATCT